MEDEEQKIVIGLTGYHRAGKDTVADYIEEEYGFRTLTFSDALKKRLKEQGKEITKMNMSKEGDKLRDKEGRAALAKELYRMIENRGWERVVMNGFLSPEEMDYIRNEVMNFHLVEVQAAPMKRFKRRSEDEPDNEEEFFKRDERDKELKGADKVMEMSDYIVHNNSDLESLHQEVDYVMADIGIERQ